MMSKVKLIPRVSESTRHRLTRRFVFVFSCVFFLSFSSSVVVYLCLYAYRFRDTFLVVKLGE